jgi:hypothetical protein
MAANIYTDSPLSRYMISMVQYRYPTIYNIDIRRLSRPPPPPLLPVISCIIDSALLYIMVARHRNTIWPPPLQLSIHRRAALLTNSNGTQSAHKGKRGGRTTVDTILMSMIYNARIYFKKDYFKCRLSCVQYLGSWKSTVLSPNLRTPNLGLVSWDVGPGILSCHT